MRISLVQSNLEWENPKANIEAFSRKLESIAGVDLIVLPEMFATGFTMDPKAVAEPMDGESVAWMKKTSAEKNAAICGSLAIAENGNFYNRMLFVYPNGEIAHYDKRHLFTLAGEHQSYTPGKEKMIVDFNGYRIRLLVCYDLRFPVFSRNDDDYDLLIYVANWPEPRILAWDTLLRARAIENMSYVVGVNRVGVDGNGHRYIGHSQAFDALGGSLIDCSESDDVMTVELNKNALLEARQKFGFLNDRDRFTVI